MSVKIYINFSPRQARDHVEPKGTQRQVVCESEAYWIRCFIRRDRAGDDNEVGSRGPAQRQPAKVEI